MDLGLWWGWMGLGLRDNDRIGKSKSIGRCLLCFWCCHRLFQHKNIKYHQSCSLNVDPLHLQQMGMWETQQKYARHVFEKNRNTECMCEKEWQQNVFVQGLYLHWLMWPYAYCCMRGNQWLSKPLFTWQCQEQRGRPWDLQLVRKQTGCAELWVYERYTHQQSQC